MSASLYRSRLEARRKLRIEAERKAGDYRNRESAKRAEAAKARQAAARLKAASSVQSKLREADRREDEAAAAGKEASRWQSRASGYAKDESALMTRLVRAERDEANAAERRRKMDEQRATREDAAERARLRSRIEQTESEVRTALRTLRAPRSEKLRVLILGASSEGDLRVGREQKRIRAAVQSALHRDQIELDVRPAATTADLLDGITRFRPHVVHFSGHSSESLIVFEDEIDVPHEGVIVSATAFANAIGATDDPPLLVFLNSCHSASQAHNLVRDVAPFAIGMADTIEDADAITYSAQFYAAVANGQSIGAAHLSGRAALELSGLSGHDLPTLAHADDVDPSAAILVRPLAGEHS
ncbi:MAG TPA: hypothetical protein PKD84_07260 [Propionicimonas sp.]|nr:hypothetical protein [Propionicimonas sp.]